MFALSVIAGATVALAGATAGLAVFFAGKGFSASVANILAGFVLLIGSGFVGLIIATPLIVAGELILIFLDQRNIAARHLRVTRAMYRMMRGSRTPDGPRTPRRRVI